MRSWLLFAANHDTIVEAKQSLKIWSVQKCSTIPFWNGAAVILGYWICVITKCGETGRVPPASGVIVKASDYDSHSFFRSKITSAAAENVNTQMGKPDCPVFGCSGLSGFCVGTGLTFGPAST